MLRLVLNDTVSKSKNDQEVPQSHTENQPQTNP